MKYKTLETSYSLFLAYQSLARDYKRVIKIREPLSFGIDEKKVPTSTTNFNNYNHSFALLILNASILEGTLRSILSEKVQSDIEIEIKKGLREGRTKPSISELLLYSFRDEVEMQGGWDKLKKHYKFYFGVQVDKIKNNEEKEAIDTLFVLRNILAHGTAIVQPSEKMVDGLDDTYPYSWQKKVHGAGVYLKRKYGSDDIFINLAESEVPSHFLKSSVKYLNSVVNELDYSPVRAKPTLDMLNSYTFGTINYLR